MKKISFLLALIPGICLLFSCGKKDYSVRFKNDFNEAVYNVKAGNASLGRIAPGETSNYENFTGNSFVISGTSDSGIPLNGSESVSGKGKHKWTITLNSTGKIDFAEDPL